jgi:hypothetical protein
LGGTKTREDEHLNSRLRDIETRLEALYKWGNLYSVDEEKDPTDPEQEKEDLDEETREKIAEYSKSIESGESLLSKTGFRDSVRDQGKAASI